MTDIDEAMAAWQDEYQLTPEEVDFARSLFNRRVTDPEATIQLTQDEIRWLKSHSDQVSEEGIAACREKLTAIGILLP